MSCRRSERVLWGPEIEGEGTEGLLRGVTSVGGSRSALYYRHEAHMFPL